MRYAPTGKAAIQPVGAVLHRDFQTTGDRGVKPLLQKIEARIQ